MAGRLRLHIPALRLDGVAELLSPWLASQAGVTQVRLSSACASILIEYDASGPSLMPRLEPRLRALTVPLLREENPPAPAPQTLPEKTAPSGPSFLSRFAISSNLSMPWTTLSLAASLFAGPAALWVNVPLLAWNSLPIWKRALTVLFKERRLNVDFLDAISIMAALSHGQIATTAFVIWLISLGDWIRDLTAQKSKRAIKDLLDYQSRTAWVLRGSEVVQMPATAVCAGDTVIVYPGEIIPVDGDVLKGVASVDQKTITGESMPVTRRAGDRVYAATAVRDGKLFVCATRVGDDTTAAQIVHLVEAAPVGETRMQNYAEKFADRLVAPWLAGALGLWAVTGDLSRLISMTMIDYGTGIRVAAPTTMLASMTSAARQGIIIRSGSHMEKLAHVDTIIFDKTGTLTEGVPAVLTPICYRVNHFPPREVIALAAAVEARLKHPVAEAVMAKAKAEGVTIPARAESKYEVGQGMEARVNGYNIHVGSSRFLERAGIKLDEARSDAEALNRQGCSTLYFAVNGDLTALIPYTDQIRPESKDVLRALHNRGIKRTIMLTGDNAMVAKAVAGQLGIDVFFSDTLPADKAEIVQQLQREGSIVAMVGDGINDSPALSYADVGIAMKNGADVARETADVVLMEDSLWKILNAIEISREALSLVRENYGIIAVMNTIALGLAIPTGMVNPGITALISNGSAILASLNAIRPLLED